VERIAGGAKKPIAIDYLCPEFGGTVHGRGRVVFGSPGKYFDEIASNYPDLQWSLSEKGLRIEIFGGTERASSFDEVAGHLMIQARAKLDGKYLKPSDYQAIAKKLDEAGFEMPDYLQGSFRKELAQWNQRHPGKRSKPFTPRSTLNNPSDLGAVSA